MIEPATLDPVGSRKTWAYLVKSPDFYRLQSARS